MYARYVLATIACTAAWVPALSAAAAEDDAVQHDLKIERQPLSRALQEFAKQCGVQIIFFSAVTDGREAPALQGRFTTSAALAALLRDSQLVFRELSPNTIEIRLQATTNTTRSVGAPAAQDAANNPEEASMKQLQTTERTTETGPQKKSSRLTRLSISGAIMSAAAVTGATAADAPDSKASLEEIVVTAQRREETSQRTPLSITALSGDMLNAQGVTNVTSLNNVVPNVQIGDAGRNNIEIFVRGIGSTNNTEVGDPALAFNIDGVYMARSRSASGTFFDLERVEVLRGPQGTLYGRNATAGSINLITKKPTDTYEGDAQLEVGNFGLVRTSAVVNLPFSESTALRAAFQTQRRDGYVDNAPLNDNYMDEDSVAGRVHLRVSPTENFSVLLSGDYFRNGGVGSVPGPLGTSQVNADPYQFAVTAEGRNSQKLYGLTLTADWGLPFATLTYIGSYHRDDQHWFAGAVDQIGGNVTGTGADTVVSCDARNNPSACGNQNFFSDEYSVSHELRVAANGERLKWVAGLYYFKENNDVLFHTAPLPGIGALVFVQPDINADSKAAFAQGTYSFTDSLRGTAGARYTKDHKDRTGGIFIGGTLAGDTYSGGTRVFNNLADVDWSSTDWKAGLEFDVSPSSLAYTSVGTGYKAGGYTDGAPPLTYGPEKLMAYEVGWKNRLFGNTVQANLSAFYYDYRDFQVSAVGEIAGQGALVTINAQKAVVYGAEFEGSALLTDADRVDMNLAYLHARYKKFELPCGDQFGSPVPPGYIPPAGCVAGSALRLPVNYNGNRLAKSPDWSASLAYEHTWTLKSAAAVKARLQTHFESDKDLEYRNFDLTKQDSFTKTDLSLSFTNSQQQWTAMAYVRNIENDAVLVFAQPRGGAPLSRTSGTGIYAPPRTYGLQLTAKF